MRVAPTTATRGWSRNMLGALAPELLTLAASYTPSVLQTFMFQMHVPLTMALSYYATRKRYSRGSTSAHLSSCSAASCRCCRCGSEDDTHSQSRKTIVRGRLSSARSQCQSVSSCPTPTQRCSLPPSICD